jgi:predicted phosphodiesterase
MKLALLGDIHSNDLALKVCLEYCSKEGVEGYLFLGDYVSDCPEPQKTDNITESIIESQKREGTGSDNCIS